MTGEQARGFYAVHAARPFYNDLVAFMTSGPVVVQVLEGEDAIARYRDRDGRHQPGRGRRRARSARLFAENIERNSVHGSDAPETAATEIGFFFSDVDIVG